MKKYYLSLSTTFLLFLSGCNTTTALNHFKKDPKSANAIQYTKKADLIYKNELNSMIFATYLNNINKEYKSEKLDSFVVGIHLTNKDEHDFLNNGYSILLNDNTYKSINKIDEKSELVSSIPLRNNWANYYLIKFENDKSQTMNISLNHPVFGKTELSFQK